MQPTVDSRESDRGEVHPILADPSRELTDTQGHSPTLSYGAFVPVVDEFLPLGGGGGDDALWSHGHVVSMDGADMQDADPKRPSATKLIYLCALCSSLTSVLLGYG